MKKLLAIVLMVSSCMSVSALEVVTSVYTKHIFSHSEEVDGEEFEYYEDNRMVSLWKDREDYKIGMGHFTNSLKKDAWYIGAAYEERKSRYRHMGVGMILTTGYNSFLAPIPYVYHGVRYENLAANIGWYGLNAVVITTVVGF